MPLELGDPLAHRALQALLRAETAVRRRLAADLEREGISAAGFSVLVVLTTAGGALARTPVRRRLAGSTATAPVAPAPRAGRGLVPRRRTPADRRVVVVELTAAGDELVERLFPEHAARVARAFGALDEREKRSFTELCRKLAA